MVAIPIKMTKFKVRAPIVARLTSTPRSLMSNLTSCLGVEIVLASTMNIHALESEIEWAALSVRLDCREWFAHLANPCDDSSRHFTRVMMEPNRERQGLWLGSLVFTRRRARRRRRALAAASPSSRRYVSRCSG